MLLGTEPAFAIVGEASDGQVAIDLVEHLKPDVLVVDVVMPSLDGLEVARRTSKLSPATRVVVLSMYDNEAYVLEALKAGAKAYVLKEATTDELMRAIREAAKGHYYLSHPLSSRIIEDYRQRVSTSAMQDPYETLTYRERDILHLIVEGYSYTEIARRLSISHRTVETHRKNLMRKLGLRTTTMLILYALRRGILPPQCPENQSQSLSAS